MSVPTEPAISSQHTNLSTMDTDAWVDLALRKLQKKARSNRMRNMREQVYASLQQQGRSDITMDMIKITYQSYNKKYIVRHTFQMVMNILLCKLEKALILMLVLESL